MTGRLPGIVALVLLAAAAPAGALPPSPALPLSPCQLSHAASAARVAARCGTLSVPEDPAQPGGRQIALRVAVVPSESPDARPDPVFILAGGPGQSITEVFPRLAPAFDRVRRDRDLVLVDQRGTGGSGRLSCPDLSRPEREGEFTDAAGARLAEACLRSLSGDLRRYGTGDFVRDLEAVRAALRVERVNLVGFSYGTRAALAYARAHPDRARTLVLDGVAPFEMVVGQDFDVDSQRALTRLFARCASEPACRERYPNLEADFRKLLERLDRHPETVRLRHPLTAVPTEIHFDGDHLRQVTLAFLYQPETAALLPALLREAMSGDLAPLAAQSILAASDFQVGMSRPLQLSVLCAEDVPLYADPPPGSPPTFLGGATRRAFRELCAPWPRDPLDPSFHRAPRIETPALLLSGENDPVTPPRWAATAAASLPASRRIEVPAQAHGVLVRGCLPRIVADFVKRGSAEGLDLSCAARIPPSPIFLDLQGGAP